MAFTRTQLLPGSDIQAELQMPSLYHLILQASGVPDPRLAAVLKLLDGENPFKPLTDKERGAQLAANARGLYEVAALCMVQPKLILDRAPTGADEIGPADLPFGDLEVVYYNFFRNPRRAESAAEPADQSDGSADAASGGE